MKNFKVVQYLVLDKNGNEHADFNSSFNRMTRKIARAFKNYLNIASPNNAPHRIAEVRITK